MASSLGPEIFNRGFRFNPTPLEAATYYLPRLVAGAPLHEAVRPVVHHAQVYACEPGDLARMFPPMPKTGHRFFFTHCKLQQPHKTGKASRPARAAGGGSWHSQSVTDVVDGAGAKVGEVRKLRYKKAGAYTDWLMDEFSTLCSEDAIVAGDRQYVLCNMYVSPRAAPDSAARHESAAFFAPPAPVVIAQPAAATKRPAAPQVAKPPCPKRMRGAVAPAPPAMQPASYCTTPFVPPPPYATASAPPPPPLPTRFVAPPPPPVPTRLAAPPLNRPPAPAPPQPKQQMPPPPPPLPVVRACHVPVAQAPAPHCQPQAPAEKTKQRTLDPFEAAELRYEAEEDERVAAPSADPEEPPPVALDEDDVWARELEQYMEDKGEEPTAEGSTMTRDEMEQHFKLLLDF
ncbi:unnamed protein product [Urochloa humidicola]